MKANNLILYSPVILAVLIIAGCNRQGCTDKNALNYESNARRDCGCCAYEASHTFWWDDRTQEKLQEAGATQMRVFLDGNMVHAKSTGGFWDSPSFCHEEGSITVTKSWSGATSTIGNYMVKDQKDSVWWSGTLNFEPGVCNATKLIR
jgi:hypothetical protein